MNSPNRRWPACLLVAFGLLPHAALAQAGLSPVGALGPASKAVTLAEPRTPISALPYSINAPGSYYLVSSLTGTASGGITISASGVTLDLMGFELVGGSGSGIAVSGTRSNIAIHDGTVRGWQASGVDAASASNTRFEDLRLTGNNKGDVIDMGGLVAGARAIVARCQADANGAGGNYGNGIAVGQGGVVRDCSASGNARRGITTDHDCTMLGCTAIGNPFFGIGTGDGCSLSDCTANSNGDGFQVLKTSTIRGCTARSNTGNGILAGDCATVTGCSAFANTLVGISGGVGSTLTGCSAQSNLVNGIAASNGSTVVGCTSDSNHLDGISVSFGSTVMNSSVVGNLYNGITVGSDCTVRSCTSRRNDGNGISIISGASGVTVGDCTVGFNGIHGIVVGSASLVSRNNCAGNGRLNQFGCGILTAAASSNRIEENNVTGTPAGIVTSAGNIVLRNTARGNLSNYQMSADSRYGPIINITAAGTPAAIGSGTYASTLASTDPWANFSF